MMRQTPDPDNRLVWSFTTSNSAIRTKYGMDPIIYSGGDHPCDNGRGTHAVIVRLPQAYTAVIFISSNDMGSASLATIAVNAFLKGTRD